MFSPIEFNLTPSRSLIYLILGSHTLVLISLYLAQLEPFVRTMLVAFTLLSLALHVYRYGSSNYRNRINALRWNADRQEISVRRDERWLAVDKIDSAVVLPYAVVLRLKTEGYLLPQSLVVMFDGLPEAEFRRLRVLALHGAYVKAPDGV